MMTDDEGGEGDTGRDCSCSSQEASDSTRDAGEFRLGSMLEALSHPTRRKVLVHLDSRDGEATLDELASDISGPYAVRDPLRRSSDRDHHVKMELHHVHAPKLDAEGLVTYDPADQTVSITDDGADALRRLF